MSLSPDSRVGEIAARHPLATRVFARHGIDFCCSGGVALADACAKREIDPAGVLQEIEREITSPGADLATRNWQEAPLGDLVVHIVERYHDPLREELPRLEAMARKVFRVHGDKDPERLGALLEFPPAEERARRASARGGGIPLPLPPPRRCGPAFAGRVVRRRPHPCRSGAPSDSGVDGRLPRPRGGVQHLERPLARSRGARDGSPRAHPSREQRPVPARRSSLTRTKRPASVGRRAACRLAATRPRLSPWIC